MSEHLRTALLVGCTLSADPVIQPLDRSVVRNTTESLATALAGLGSHAFRYPGRSEPRVMLNPTLGKLIEAIEGAHPKTVGTKHTFLLYYFGHGFIAEGDLYLPLNSRTLETAKERQNYTLSAILNHSGFRRHIIILDCCHAGLARQTIKLNLDGSFCVMTSSEAGYSYHDGVIGQFTRGLVEALSPGNLAASREPQTGGITLQTWFDYAANRSNDQKPQIEGGLKGDVLVPLEREIPDRYRDAAPKRSLYVKLYRILEKLETPRTPAELRRTFVAAKDSTFELTQAGVDGQRRYVGVARFEEYLIFAEQLGLAARVNERWTLSKRGQHAVQSSGDRFNRRLVECIYELLAAFHVSSEGLRESLVGLTSRSIIPDVVNIERLLLERGALGLPRRLLRECLRLLSYSEVLRRTGSDAFFPT